MRLQHGKCCNSYTDIYSKGTIIYMIVSEKMAQMRKLHIWSGISEMKRDKSASK